MGDDIRIPNHSVRIRRLSGRIHADRKDEYGHWVVIPHRVQHSPTGMEYGYGGSGPSDLALSILMTFLPEPLAEIHYQSFKWEFLASGSLAEGEEVVIDGDVIRTWLMMRMEVER